MRPDTGPRTPGTAVRASGALVVLLSLTAASVVDAQYLAVFVDGRILHVTGARMEGERRIRLDLPNGGMLEVSATRIDRVIEDILAEEPVTIPEPPPGCELRFRAGELAEGVAFREEILAAARQADLHPRLVAEVVDAESRFNPFAVSRVGAAGLMQLMPAVWIGAGLPTPFEPATNLKVGSQHLADLLKRYGSLELALAAYNAGAAVVDRYHGVPPYRETRGYVRRILGRFCPSSLSAPTAGAATPTAGAG